MLATALVIVYFWTHQKDTTRRMGKYSLPIVRALVLFALAILLIITILKLS